jgi:hypothetical protein
MSDLKNIGSDVAVGNPMPTIHAADPGESCKTGSEQIAKGALAGGSLRSSK